MRKTLLLADDSVTVRRVIEQTFADEPIDVVTVGEGAAALARLNREPPDVLLADIGMPAPDGYELALHVRRTPALAHIPVILLTGAFDPVDHARARDAGCAGVLVKPFDPQMLIARVRHLLHERRPAAGAPAVNRGNDPARDEAQPVHLAPSAAGPPAPDALGAPSVTVAPASAESRAAEVDDYFARLDRAFATLQAPREADDRTDVSTPHQHSSAAGAFNPVGDVPEEPRTVAGLPVSAGAEVAGESASEPRPAPERAVRDTRAGPAAPEGHILLPPSAPTLGGAFAALLAIEQGQPLPAAASGWTPGPSAEMLEQIVRRVTQEIAEAVVRDLAPGIVTEVAERVVRAETARLTSTVPER